MKTYLLTKKSHTFGQLIYVVVGENSQDETYLCSLNEAHYSDCDNWVNIKHDDVQIVDTNRSVLETNINLGE